MSMGIVRNLLRTQVDLHVAVCGCVYVCCLCILCCAVICRFLYDLSLIPSFVDRCYCLSFQSTFTESI